MRHGRKMNGAIVWVAPLLFVLFALPAAVAAQARVAREMTEREAAQALLDNRLTPERGRALRLATELGPRASAELKAAVIEAAWAEWRNDLDRPPTSEAIFDYMDAVAGLRDPRAIPFLVEVLNHGAVATNALADLGTAAFPAVLTAVKDPAGIDMDVSGGVTTLRFMVEDGSLNARQLEQVREVARERLSGTQNLFVVKAAVQLAIALGDPELRRIVERIAADRATAEALVSPYMSSGKPASRDYRNWAIDSVQEDARLFLSGGKADSGRRPFPPR